MKKLLLLTVCAFSAVLGAQEFKTYKEAERTAYATMKKRNFKKAAEYYQQTVKLAPSAKMKAAHSYNYINCLIASKNYDQTIKEADEVVKVVAANRKDLLSRVMDCVSRAYQAKKDFKNAIKWGEDAVKNNVRNDYFRAILKRRLGNYYFAVKSYEKAAESFKAAIADPKAGKSEIAAAHYDLGRLYSVMKKYPESVAEFRKAIDNPNAHVNVMASSYVNMAGVYRNMKKHEDVLKTEKEYYDVIAERKLKVNPVFTMYMKNARMLSFYYNTKDRAATVAAAEELLKDPHCKGGVAKHAKNIIKAFKK